MNNASDRRLTRENAGAPRVRRDAVPSNLTSRWRRAVELARCVCVYVCLIASPSTSRSLLVTLDSWFDLARRGPNLGLGLGPSPG